MVNQFVQKTPEIAKQVVEDICDKPAQKVSYFMKKFGLDYAEWSYLNCASIPAQRYKTEAHDFFSRWQMLMADVQHVIFETKSDDPKITRQKIVAMLERAVEKSRRNLEDEDGETNVEY